MATVETVNGPVDLEELGFTLIHEEPHSDWGIPIVGQVLALALR